MTSSPYVVQPAEKSRCPNCGATPRLLTHHDGIDPSRPAFYLCPTCDYVGQVGVGPVRDDLLEPRKPAGSGSANWFVTNMDGQMIAEEGTGQCWFETREAAEKFAHERASFNPGQSFGVNYQTVLFTGQPVTVIRKVC